jgi:hypothetical protein
MQTNLYVSAAKEDPSAFNFYNKKVYRGPSPTDGYMMPLFYLDESGQISPGDAQIFKSQVRSACSNSLHYVSMFMRLFRCMARRLSA